MVVTEMVMISASGSVNIFSPHLIPRPVKDLEQLLAGDGDLVLSGLCREVVPGRELCVEFSVRDRSVQLLPGFIAHRLPQISGELLRRDPGRGSLLLRRCGRHESLLG